MSNTVPAPRARDFAQSLQIAEREHRLGHFEQAVAIYRVVLSQCPDYKTASVDLSRSLFALREWPAAWAAFASRFEAQEGRATPALAARLGLHRTPRMQAGSRPARVAVLGEGGLGDVILFSRFVPRLIASGVDARLIVPRRLAPLLRTLNPAPAIGFDDDPAAAAGCDAWAPIMDLPALLNLAEADLSASRPYLHAEPARIERWRSWLASSDEPGPSIAIAWRGAPDNRSAALRSARLTDLAPLAAIPGVRLICLQKDAADDEIAACGFSEKILRPGPPFDEEGAFLDSAALLMCADRLVSVDTALVHLAGALSRPCDMLLGEDIDWRWLDMAPENVWHPSVRVWRGAGEGIAQGAARASTALKGGAK
jgi:hypothetical protein